MTDSRRAPTDFPFGHLTGDAGASADPVLVEIVQGSLASVEMEVETAIGRELEAVSGAEAGLDARGEAVLRDAPLDAHAERLAQRSADGGEAERIRVLDRVAARVLEEVGVAAGEQERVAGGEAPAGRVVVAHAHADEPGLRIRDAAGEADGQLERRVAVA